MKCLGCDPARALFAINRMKFLTICMLLLVVTVADGYSSSCYDEGYTYGRCGQRILLGLQDTCVPDPVISIRCRNRPEMERGLRDGVIGAKLPTRAIAPVHQQVVLTEDEKLALCQSVGQLAEHVMKMRQHDYSTWDIDVVCAVVAIDLLTNAANRVVQKELAPTPAVLHSIDVLNDYIDIIVNHAYREPLHSTENQKQQAGALFRMKYYYSCIDS